MYKNKIVCSLKHKNIPLVEDKDSIFIPFNTEYSIYLKNMSTEVALISLYVNGRDISPGEKIKILPKCSATIEKFKDTDHRFVFKEKTKAFQEAMLSNVEDGLIRLDVDFDLSAKLNPFEINFNNSNIKTMTNEAENSTLLNPQNNQFQDVLDNSNIPNSDISTMDDIHTQLYKSSGSSLFDESIKDNSASFATRGIKLNCIPEPIMKAAYDNLIQDRASLNSGVTMPGRKKETADNITFEKDKYGASKTIHQFEFIIHLKEATKSIIESKNKKTCPTCKKKFKYKYFFCPYDGTFLDY